MKVIEYCFWSRDLIKKLLVQDRTRRLGNMRVFTTCTLCLQHYYYCQFLPRDATLQRGYATVSRLSVRP